MSEDTAGKNGKGGFGRGHWLVLGVSTAVLVLLLLTPSKKVVVNEKGAARDDARPAASAPGTAAPSAAWPPQQLLARLPAPADARLKAAVDSVLAGKASAALLESASKMAVQQYRDDLAAPMLQLLNDGRKDGAKDLFAEGEAWKNGLTHPDVAGNDTLATHFNSQAARCYTACYQQDTTRLECRIEAAAAAAATSGQPMASILELRQIAEQHPENFRVNFVLGRFSLETNQLPLALERLKRATELQPSNWEARYVLAMTYERMNKPAEARASYSQSRALIPAKHPLRETLINFIDSKLKSL